MPTPKPTGRHSGPTDGSRPQGGGAATRDAQASTRLSPVSLRKNGTRGVFRRTGRVRPVTAGPERSPSGVPEWEVSPGAAFGGKRGGTAALTGRIPAFVVLAPSQIGEAREPFGHRGDEQPGHAGIEHETSRPRGHVPVMDIDQISRFTDGARAGLLQLTLVAHGVRQRRRQSVAKDGFRGLTQ
jgi:hypothetical protein